MTAHLLVVDDDPELRELLHGYLGKQGFRVTTAADGDQLQALLAGAAPDLLILDLMLPGKDGLTLCRELRTRSRLPIIMLTARGDDIDRIIGLEMGADDYLPKPFNPRELLARINSILRRAGSDPTTARAPRSWHFAGWTLDVATRNLVADDGVVVALSAGEFRVLRCLLEAANSVATRDQLLDALSGRGSDATERTIDVMISRLRRRLRDDARDPQLLLTIRNEGYLLAAEAEQRA